MRKVKVLLMTILVMLGLIVQNSIFQSELMKLDDSIYLCSFYNVDQNSRYNFLKKVDAVCSEKHVKFFTTFFSEISSNKNILNIYGSEESLSNLFGNNKIDERQYHSLLGDCTEIVYKPFEEAENLSSYLNNSVSFIGREQDINDCYNKLKKTYTISQPELYEATDEDMVIVVWIIISVIVTLMTFLIILSHNKEWAVRISLGENELKIIAENILWEITTGVFVIIFCKFLLKKICSGFAYETVSMKIYIFAVILSALMYTSIYKIDLRKSFSNVIHSKFNMYFINAIKIFTVFLSFISLTSNIETIKGLNILEISDNYFIENFPNYTYAYMRDMSAMVVNIGQDSNQNKTSGELWENLYTDYYYMLNPVICVNVLNDKIDYIFANTKMNKYISSKFGNFNENTDFIIFIPLQYKKSKHIEVNVRDIISMYFNDNLNYSIEYYNRDINFQYINSNVKTGFDSTGNPVVIYQNKQIPNCEYNIKNLMGLCESNIIYELSEKDIKNICDNDVLSKNLYELVVTTVKDRYKTEYQGIVRLAKFLSSFCFVVVMLTIVLNILIVQMSYKINAKELAIKKIMGYGIFEKNSSLIFKVLIWDTVIMVLALVFGKINALFDIKIGIIVMLGMICTDIIIVLMNLLVNERRNLVSVIKRGIL